MGEPSRAVMSRSADRRSSLARRCASRTGCSRSVSDFRRLTKSEKEDRFSPIVRPTPEFATSLPDETDVRPAEKPLVIRIIVRYRTILMPPPETRHQLRARCSRLKAYERSATMALSPFIVHVEKKPGLSFGEIMCDARFWPDRNQIEAISFKPVTSAATGVGFDIASTSRTTQFFLGSVQLRRLRRWVAEGAWYRPNYG